MKDRYSLLLVILLLGISFFAVYQARPQKEPCYESGGVVVHLKDSTTILCVKKGVNLEDFLVYY